MSEDLQENTEEAVETTESATEETTESKTILDGGGDDKPVAAPADWPEDWRDKFADGDEKVAKQMARFKSPADVAKAWREAQRKMSAGEVKATLPEDATEEQVAEYRKANGIPERAEGYLDALEGIVIGDDDRPLVDSFLESAHGKNASPEIVASALGWYYETQEKQAAARAEADQEYRLKAADDLRAEWGNEYRANINSAMNFLEAAPAADDGTPLKDLLLGARLADGTALGDSPAALRWLVDLAKDANPAGFTSPSNGQSQLETLQAEKAEIEKVMRTNRKAYNADQKMQDRYQQILAAELKLSA